MNVETAKKIKIIDFLGINTEKPSVIVFSPFRAEKTPSFKIDTQKNIWYDHGEGVGGNILDLAMKIYNTDLRGALQALENKTPISFFTSPYKIETSEKKITLKKVQPLQNVALIEYLKSRNISSHYEKLEEIYYSMEEKNYFGLAFRNDSGGYEIRNRYFKGCYGQKDVATIKGTENEKLSIFEGFMDYLSALIYFKMVEFKNDVIILNSTSNKEKIPLSLLSRYNEIFLFLDNDLAGQKAKQYFYEANKNSKDCSIYYKDFNDFNDLLTAKKQ